MAIFYRLLNDLSIINYNVIVIYFLNVCPQNC